MSQQTNEVVHVAEVLDVQALQTDPSTTNSDTGSLSNGGSAISDIGSRKGSDVRRPSPLADHFASEPIYAQPSEEDTVKAAAKDSTNKVFALTFMSANCPDARFSFFSKDCSGGFLNLGSSNCKGCGMAIFSRDCDGCYISVFSKGSKNCGMNVFDWFSDSCGISVFSRRNKRVGMAVNSNQCEDSGMSVLSNKSTNVNLGVLDNASKNCGMSIMTAHNERVCFGLLSGCDDEHEVSMFGWKNKVALCLGGKTKKPAEVDSQKTSGAPYVVA
jgi:hypothetical protein